MRINQIVSAGVIDSLGLLQNLRLHLLRNVDVIVLSPHFLFNVVDVTVVVPAVRTALVDQDRVQLIGSAFNRRIAFLNLLFDFLNS